VDHMTRFRRRIETIVFLVGFTQQKIQSAGSWWEYRGVLIDVFFVVSGDVPNATVAG